jgi:hypothetical protein
MWRQGDVFIAAVAALPEGAVPQADLVLVAGEMTGQNHRVEDGGWAQVLRRRDDLFVRVTAESVRVVHPEHGPITLPRGLYRVWQQREYAPGALRQQVWVTD